MKLNTNGVLLSFLLFTATGLACTKGQHTREEIVQAMNNYDSLIVRQDPAAIAQAFTPDGKLGDAAMGRESIQQLLSQIKNFKVIEQLSTTTSVQIRGDSALQKGSYVQHDLDAKNDTVKVMGTYLCKWRWIEGEGWKIAHIVTRPF